MKIHFNTRKEAREFKKGKKNSEIRKLDKPFNGTFSWVVILHTN